MSHGPDASFESRTVETMMRKSPFTLLLLLAAALAGCGDEATTPQAVADAAELPADQVIYQTRHVMTKDGVRAAVLEGDTAYLREADGWLDLVGVRLQFFGENGAESGLLTSDTGEYNLREGSFVARGNAVLVTYGQNGQQRVLQTEELHYDVPGDQLWSEVPFVLEEGGRTTRGTKFRSDSQFQTWSVSGATTEGGAAQPDGGGISF